MSKLFKFGGFLIAAGIITMVGAGIASGDWNALYQSTNRYVEGDPFYGTSSITTLDVDANNRRVVLAPTSEDTVYVTYYESEYDRIEISEVGNVLKITNPMDWQANFTFSFNFLSNIEERTIKIYIPTTGAYDVDIYTKNGAVAIANIDNPLTIHAKTLNGSVNLNQLPSVASARLESANGSISITATTVSGGIQATTANGFISISGQTSANSIKATTSNGYVNVKETIADDYDLASSNGSVELSAPGPMEDYYVTLHTNLGSLYLNGNKTTTESYGNSALLKRIDMSTSNGDIRLRFVSA